MSESILGLIVKDYIVTTVIVQYIGDFSLGCMLLWAYDICIHMSINIALLFSVINLLWLISNF